MKNPTSVLFSMFSKKGIFFYKKKQAENNLKKSFYKTILTKDATMMPLS
jgi:hypothetical protein